MPQTFRKIERLRRHKTITNLFSEGQVLVKYPFRAVYLEEALQGFPPCKIMVSVSKKRFKRANMRNLIRRRTKEAYRLQKNVLYKKLEEMKLHLDIALIYLPKEELDYHAIEKGMGKLIDKLMLQLAQKQPSSNDR
ncbi:MAG: ribonuclease P protein component [Breznakibacter sp.]